MVEMAGGFFGSRADFLIPKRSFNRLISAATSNCPKSEVTFKAVSTPIGDNISELMITPDSRSSIRIIYKNKRFLKAEIHLDRGIDGVHRTTRTLSDALTVLKEYA